MLGNSVGRANSRTSSEAQLTTINHHYTNISASSSAIFFDEPNGNARNDEDDERDFSDNSITAGCFSFVSGHGSERKKKYKKLQKSSPIDNENRQLIASSSERKSSGKNKRFDKGIKFPTDTLNLTRKINDDLIFYQKFEKNLVAVGTSSELTEEDYIYIRSKNAKNKNSSSGRLLQSLDAIDVLDDEDELSQCGGNRHVKIYSKSFDNLSIAGDFQFERNGSQFTRECFLKNGAKANDVGESESSDEDFSHRQY